MFFRGNSLTFGHFLGTVSTHRTLIITFAFSYLFTAATTAGTEFQLVFMENVVEAPADGPLEVHVSNTGGLTASVTVSSPGNNCPSETKNVPASKFIISMNRSV